MTEALSNGVGRRRQGRGGYRGLTPTHNSVFRFAWMIAHHHRVLHVEDDNDTRDGLEVLLRVHGFEVMAVNGAQVALATLRDGFRCCVILLDWRMPGMNGEEFRREQMVDERLAGVPVVALSADAISTEQAHRLGIRAVLRKPAGVAQIIGTLERYCDCR
jgi:two-component system sensor histidine kinase/response regulator